MHHENIRLVLVGLDSTAGKKSIGGKCFFDSKLKLEFLAATDCAEIELPKFSGESKPRPTLIEIDNQLQTNHPPDIRERNISANRLESDVCVEGEKLPVFDKAIKGIAVEVIAVCRIGCPIGVRIVRGDDQNSATRPGDAMKLGDKRHHIRHMLSDVTANDVVELVIRKRIRNRSEIVNDICMGLGICVDADRARCLIPATTNIKNLCFGQRALVWRRFSHRPGMDGRAQAASLILRACGAKPFFIALAKAGKSKA